MAPPFNARVATIEEPHAMVDRIFGLIPTPVTEQASQTTPQANLPQPITWQKKKRNEKTSRAIQEKEDSTSHSSRGRSIAAKCGVECGEHCGEE